MRRTVAIGIAVLTILGVGFLALRCDWYSVWQRWRMWRAALAVPDPRGAALIRARVASHPDVHCDVTYQDRVYGTDQALDGVVADYVTALTGRGWTLLFRENPLPDHAMLSGAHGEEVGVLTVRRYGERVEILTVGDPEFSEAVEGIAAERLGRYRTVFVVRVLFAACTVLSDPDVAGLAPRGAPARSVGRQPAVRGSLD